ncbi:uncharacterized protein LOC117650839 [Thrips palmi]|uniref:Gustatory receptor n=1 Tax=Thrips palmi TaxID=161013 RepID=A0A6P8ZY51_THRPL|nr:uncharacterized protein LOC117650839 [Thrips palmi]
MRLILPRNCLILPPPTVSDPWKSWETWKFWKSYNKWSWRGWIYISLVAALLPTLGIVLLADEVSWCKDTRTTFLEETRTNVRWFKISMTLVIIATSFWYCLEVRTVMLGLQHCLKYSLSPGRPSSGPSSHSLQRVLGAIVVLAVASLFATVPVVSIYTRDVQKGDFRATFFNFVTFIASTLGGLLVCQLATLWALGADLHADVLRLVENDGANPGLATRRLWHGLRVRQTILRDLMVSMFGAFGVQTVAFILGDTMDCAFSLYTNLSFSSTLCVTDTAWAVVMAMRLVLIFVLCQRVRDEHEALSHILNSFLAKRSDLTPEEVREVKAFILKVCLLNHSCSAGGMLPMDLSSMKAAILFIISNCLILMQFDRAMGSSTGLP